MDRALVFEPGTESVWAASANLDQLFLQRPDEASRKRAKAQDLIRHQSADAFAERYLDKSRAAPFVALQKGDGLQALAYFDLALTNPLVQSGNPFALQLGKAQAWLMLNDLSQALACSLAAAKTAPSTNLWQAEELSAMICHELKNKTSALGHVEIAMAAAPLKAKPALLQLKSQIQSLP